MSLTDKELEQLEQYRSGASPEAERKALERRLEEDAAFREKAERWMHIVDGLEELGERRLRALFRKEDSALPPLNTGGEPLAGRRKKWIIAGMLAAAAVVAAIFLLPKLFAPSVEAATPLEALAREEFAPYPYFRQPLSVTDPVAAPYAEGDFKTVISLLEQDLQLESDTLAQFYLGIAYLDERRAPEAAAVFERIQQAPDVPPEATRWYLALAYLSNNRPAQAISLLEELAQSTWTDREKAVSLLQKIRVITSAPDH